ncbi:pyridoxamine 5'-phosphate oxidase family protein [Streptomyces sp. NPDC050617]|uniref:pyridoxamine 5'-phosphate oxidase family protein n=1 Tax=Streptomyces sp. NPDC050617 TaxID=3154628 RepID=UPI00342E847B
MSPAPRGRTAPREAVSPDAIYHEGERAVQRAAGVEAEADRVSVIHGTRVELTAQAFLSSVSCVALGAADAEGRMWASVLLGEAGFVRASPGSVRVLGRPEANAPDAPATPDAPPTPEASAIPDASAAPDAPDSSGEAELPTSDLSPDDPIGPREPGDPVGLIAMDFTRRRRLRVNGRVRSWGPRLIELGVDEAYGNCPRFIHRRPLDTGLLAHGRRTTSHRELGYWDTELISRADTLFIATKHPEAGADVSHRGGPAGFLRVAGPNRVQLPDYAGNAMFNTLGNLWSDPRVGLVLRDFATGDTVQLTGRAAIEHEPPRTVWGLEVERVVDITVDRVVRTRSARASSAPW